MTFPNDFWQKYSPEDLDRQYDARASVASFEAEYAQYVALSTIALADPRRLPDLTYDPATGMGLDLYLAGPGTPLFLWIHGGYWRALSKADNGFSALGLLENGVSVAVMDYSLCPAVTLDEIVRQVRQAVIWLHLNAHRHGCDGRRIHIGGSSAGGHLAGMALSTNWYQLFDIKEDIIGSALALSGLFDIAPLRFTKVNSWLNIDAEGARRNSPIRHIPARSTTRLLASVGGLETSEFQRQTFDFAEAWRAAGHSCQIIPMPDYNHFNIALSLSDPEGALCKAVCAAL